MQALNRGTQPVACEVRVQLEGADTGDREKFTLTPGVTRVRALVPDISLPRSVTVSLVESGGNVLASREQSWQPQRHWKVYLMKSSHEDLGYENYIFHKQREIATFIDLARGFSGPADGATPNDHYMMESLLFQRNYLEERAESAWREIVEKHLKTGHMGIFGTPHGVHAHWMDYEELARLTYPGRREAKDRFGLDLKTFLIVDNPSMSWAGCQAIADAGFRYMARWGQPWRTGGNNDYRATILPAIFWWVAPNGKSRVLYGWRSGYGISFWFGQARGYGGLLEPGADNVNRILKDIESGATLGPYPYDALVNPEYTDHEIPFPNAGALREWANRYRYPEIRTDHPERFFAYMEQKYGAEIPSLAGDLNNFSADYASIDPESQGWKRRAARLLPLAEGVAALANLLDPAFLPPAALIERTFTRLFDYDEHSWPTLPRANDFQLFNAQWVKQHEARRALRGAAEAFAVSFRAFARQIPTGAQPALAVFNPLAHERTDVVEVEPGVEGLADPSTGKPVVIQKLPDGRTAFIAERVPAFGY